MKSTLYRYLILLCLLVVSCKQNNGSKLEETDNEASTLAETNAPVEDDSGQMDEDYDELEEYNPGYNELANEDDRESFTISDYNTDNPEVKNISRPDSSTVNTSLDTTLLFQIWVEDPDAPCATFYITKKSFFVVDYDGKGDMPYILNNKSLKIYYNDFIQNGEIVSLTKETLKIRWEGIKTPTVYTRWKN